MHLLRTNKHTSKIIFASMQCHAHHMPNISVNGIEVRSDLLVYLIVQKQSFAITSSLPNNFNNIHAIYITANVLITP